MLAVFPVKQLKGLIPLLVIVFVGGRDDTAWRVGGAGSALALVVGLGMVRWLTVRYRVDAERVELRTGLLNRQHRSLRRDRVRTVDLTASLVHRVLGLSVVEIGTGSQSSSEGRLSLDAVSHAEADRLRRELLDRSMVPDAPDAHRGTARETADETAPAAEGRIVARLRPSWLRFAPLTTSGVVAVGAAAGLTFQVADGLGVRVTDLEVLQVAGARLESVPIWVAVVAVVAALVLVGSLGSLIIYLEAWWGYRLTEERDGTLRLRRGLLTTRSLSIERSRVRGAEVAQSPLLRVFGGARCSAVTTGLKGRSSGGAALVPPAPLAEAHRVAAAALGLDEATGSTAAGLRRHPPAALRRRLTRVLVPAAAAVAIAWWLRPELGPMWSLVLIVLPVAALVGFDRHRNLGHALTSEYLVIGQPSVTRRRTALERRGVIGWRLRQTVFQRGAGLVTLDVVTAAGSGRYSVVDLPMVWALRLVDAVDPGLLPIAVSAPAGTEQAPGDFPARGAGHRAHERLDRG
jgi:putative membrane protein